MWLQRRGDLTVDDIDGDNSVESQEDAATSYGTFSITDEGNWTYTLDNNNTAVQALSAGAILTETVQITSADGTPQNINIRDFWI